jgi:hypothetical protein
MLIKAAPRAPARAATLPPPGAGAELANSFKKELTGFPVSFSGITLSFYCFPFDDISVLSE